MTNPRELTLARLTQACKNYHGWYDSDNNTRMIKRLEISCYNAAIDQCERRKLPRSFQSKDFVDIYSAEVYRIIANLDCLSSVGSDYLIKALMAGDINPFLISNLTNIDLCPAASQQESDEIVLKNNQSFAKKHCKLYTCKACGCTDTELDEHQTRSADENATITVRCVGCGNSWRIT